MGVARDGVFAFAVAFSLLVVVCAGAGALRAGGGGRSETPLPFSGQNAAAPEKVGVRLAEACPFEAPSLAAFSTQTKGSRASK